MKFKTTNSLHSTLNIGNKERYIEDVVNKKILGLQIDNHINWKNHTEQMIQKLSGTYYATRLPDHISNSQTLKSIYYAYFHSIIKYRIFFGGTLPTLGRFSLYQRQSSELWPVHNPEPHVEVY
jgi:hypothetical protein